MNMNVGEPELNIRGWIMPYKATIAATFLVSPISTGTASSGGIITFK